MPRGMRVYHVSQSVHTKMFTLEQSSIRTGASSYILVGGMTGRSCGLKLLAHSVFEVTHVGRDQLERPRV